MISSPSMLVGAAKKAGIDVPSGVAESDFSLMSCHGTHFKFWVFCILQLNRAVYWGEHWTNAKVLASISEEDLKELTPKDLEERGFSFGPNGLNS